MAEPESQSCQSLVEHCRQVPKALSCHKKIIDNSSVIQSNYGIMQLYNPIISPLTLKQIMFNVTEFEPKVNITDIKKMTISDGFVAYRFDELYAAFRRIAA